MPCQDVRRECTATIRNRPTLAIIFNISSVITANPYPCPIPFFNVFRSFSSLDAIAQVPFRKFNLFLTSQLLDLLPLLPCCIRILLHYSKSSKALSSPSPSPHPNSCYLIPLSRQCSNCGARPYPSMLSFASPSLSFSGNTTPFQDLHLRPLVLLTTSPTTLTTPTSALGHPNLPKHHDNLIDFSLPAPWDPSALSTPFNRSHLMSTFLQIHCRHPHHSTMLPNPQM